MTESNNNKPNFAAWDTTMLAKLTHDIWDDNIRLREANEQLRMDNKDLSKLLREQLKEKK